MKTKIALLVCTAANLILSCQKPAAENSNNTGVTKKELLTSKAWIVQKAEEKENSGPWTNVFPLWDACYKDNTWKFKADFTLEYNEATVACSGNTPNQALGTVNWAFADNETKITSGPVTYLIEQLDAATLIVVETETSGGITYSAKTTFRH